MALSILSEHFCIRRPCKVTMGQEWACPGDELRAGPPAHGPSDNHSWLVLLCPPGEGTWSKVSGPVTEAGGGGLVRATHLAGWEQSQGRRWLPHAHSSPRA